MRSPKKIDDEGLIKENYYFKNKCYDFIFKVCYAKNVASFVL